jgi:hypothetical protein
MCSISSAILITTVAVACVLSRTSHAVGCREREEGENIKFVGPDASKSAGTEQS